MGRESVLWPRTAHSSQALSPSNPACPPPHTHMHPYTETLGHTYTAG